jgi:CDP-paratose 2-epimerase
LREEATRYAFRDKAAIDEDFPVDKTGHTPYGVSKYAGDLYVQEYAHTYGMKTAVFRMSCIYGPRQFGFEDQGWVAWFLISALKKRPLTIYGDGKQVRDMLFVTDLVDAFAKFIEGPCQSDVFNIGGGPDNTSSLLELIVQIERQLGCKVPYAFADWRPCDQKIYVSNIARAASRLDWRPAVSVAQGCSRVIDWIKQNSDLF